MSKKKKRKKSAPAQKGGGYKKFLLEVQEMLDLLDYETKLSALQTRYQRLLFHYRVRIANPKAANALVTSKELKTISQKQKHYYREQNHDLKGIMVSTYQVMLLYCFTSVYRQMRQDQSGKSEPDVIQMKKTTERLFGCFFSQFIVDYFRVAIQLSNPCYKYYSPKISLAHVTADNPMMKLVSEIAAVPAVRQYLKIDGVSRPVFRLGKPMATESLEWVCVKREVLGDYYQGSGDQLDVYVQSHVIRRLSQRLDLLDREGINYLIWEHTHTITRFEIYKGYLLLPVKLYDVKVGYFLASIVEEQLLFRTFLFVTHRFTPEGDRLAELSGLGKEDMKYWKIDRLSSLVDLDKEKHHHLLALFEASGINGLSKLKDQNFDTDQLQSGNLEGLMEYLKKGRGVLAGGL